MQSIKEVYPDAFKYGVNDGPRSCGPMLLSFNHTIELVGMIGDRTGDNLVLLENAGQFGFLAVGWGSCVDCDALLGCRNYKDVDELRDLLYSQIRWEPSAEAMRTYLVSRDWELAWYGRFPETARFLAEAFDLLTKRIEETE